MKERSIIMSAEEVLAILDGRKTQVRRPIKPQPQLQESFSHAYPPDGPRTSHGWSAWYPSALHPKALHYGGLDHFRKGLARDFSPFGVPGDRLWVKEKWNAGNPVHPFCFGIMFNEPPQEGMKVVYQADKENDSYIPPLPWRSSVHMPRWASRLTLEIADVRVQQVQEISEEDAKAEGLIEWEGDPKQPNLRAWRAWDGHKNCCDPRRAFRFLWDSRYAKRGYGWDQNPWVFAVTFRIKQSAQSAEPSSGQPS